MVVFCFFLPRPLKYSCNSWKPAQEASRAELQEVYLPEMSTSSPLEPTNVSPNVLMWHKGLCIRESSSNGKEMINRSSGKAGVMDTRRCVRNQGGQCSHGVGEP